MVPNRFRNELKKAPYLKFSAYGAIKKSLRGRAFLPPPDKIRLNSIDNILENSTLYSFRINVCMLFGPQDLFVFKPEINFEISSSEVGDMKKLCMFGFR